MSKIIIGFAGRQRSGKSCLSIHLQETKNAEIVTVASALKNLVCRILNTDVPTLNDKKNSGALLLNAFPHTATLSKYGYSDEDCEYKLTLSQAWVSEATEIISEETGVPAKLVEQVLKTFNNETTVRDVLQKIGTEIIRNYNPQWHVTKLTENIKNSNAPIVVVDDIRFPNEREAVENLGGTVFFIVRPDLTIPISNHSSETSLRWQDFTSSHIIINCYSKEVLFSEFDEMLCNNFLLTSFCPLLKSYYYDNISEIKQSFGVDEYTEPRKNELKQICIDSAIKNNGVILYNSIEPVDTRLLASMLYKNQFSAVRIPYYNFVVWDPFIIENIKFYINN